MSLYSLNVTEGSGKKIAVDRITEGSDTLEVQAIKLLLGGEGVKGALLAAGQAVMASSLPMVIASDQTAIPVTFSLGYPMPTAKTRAFISPTITVSATVYDANDCVGGKQTLTGALRTSGGSGVWKSVLLRDASNQKPSLMVVLFDADPTAATLTDHSAVAFSTDLNKVIRAVLIPSSAWNTVGGAGLVDVNIEQAVKAASGTALYATFMCVGAPDFVATNDLSVTYSFEQD